MTPLLDGNATGVMADISNVRLLQPAVTIDPIERLMIPTIRTNQ